jgi:hypothetical protein
MLILMDSTIKKVNELGPHVAQLVTPRSRHRPGAVFAVDNSAFSGFDENLYMACLKRILKKNQKPLFVTMPDVVADHAATMQLWYRWHRDLRLFNRAFVLQDGITDWKQVPWDYCESVFIGGSTEFKLGATVRLLVRYAKLMGKWVHMGRVNSVKRLQYAREIGCDSIDGSGLSRFTRTEMPRMIRAIDNEQLTLLERG